MLSGASTSLARFTRGSSRRMVWLAAAGGLALFTAACGSTSTGTGTGSGSNPPSSSSGAAAGSTVGMTTASLGSVLTDSKGNTLYILTSDHGSTTACDSVCLHYWVPVTAAGTPVAGSGVTAKLGSDMEANGTHQLTVNGALVYTYVGDHGAGQVSGQGVKSNGGTWWALTPTGAWITGAAASTSASSTPSATHSSGGGGYGY